MFLQYHSIMLLQATFVIAKQILPLRNVNRAHFATSMKFGMRLPWVKPKKFGYGATLKSRPEANGSHFSKWPPEENLKVLASL